MKWIAPPVCLLTALLCMPAYSGSSGTKISFRYGEQTTEADIVGGRNNLDYNYRKYGIGFYGNLSGPVGYTLRYDLRRRKYSLFSQYDNKTRNLHAGIDISGIKAEGYSLESSFNYYYRDKNYSSRNNKLDFVQNKLNIGTDFTAQDTLKAGTEAGINIYRFPDNPLDDRNKYYGRLSLKKYFDNKKAVVYAASKIQYTDFSKGGGRGEDVTEGGIDIHLPAKIVSLVSISGERGERSTIEDNEEETLDYRYRQYEASLRHNFGERVEAKSAYGKTHRKYTGRRYDSSGHYIEADAKVYMLKKKEEKAYLIFGAEYTERRYKYLTGASYSKYSVKGGIRYNLRGKRAAGIMLQSGSYGYADKEESNKNVYSFLLDITLYMTERARLDIGWRFRYKDNLGRSDLIQNSAEAEIKWDW